MAIASAAGSARFRLPSLTAFFAECATFFQLVGSAQRVANAVENRRRPDPEDLRLLGITEPPASW